MKKLLRLTRCFLAATVFCTAAFVTVVIIQPINWKPYSVTILVIAVISVLIFGKSSEKLKTARLIVENQILHIQPAVFQEKDSRKETVFLPGESIEVFISCFGILLDSKIVKFNQEGIHLKTVELGRDFISLTYGTNQKIHRIEILHSKISDEEIAEISRKFLYESGVVPRINY